MRKLAIVILVMFLLTVSGCDKPAISTVTQNLLISVVENYLGANYKNFERGMEDRGWEMPDTPDDAVKWAKDFAYVLKYVIRHHGPPPTEVRSLGVERSPLEAFGGIK